MIRNYFNIENMIFQRIILFLFLWPFLISCSMNTLLQEEEELFPEAKEIFEKIKSKKTIRSVRAFVSFEISFPETKNNKSIFHQEIGFEQGAFSGNAFLVWKKPNLFRMEILSPFGNPYFSIVGKEKSLKIFNISKKKLYVSDFTIKTMNNLFGIPIELETLLDILSVLKPKFIETDYRFDKKKGVLLPVQKDINSKTFWINKNSLMPSKVKIDLSGQKLYVYYKSYKEIAGIQFPKSILVVNPKTKAHLKIQIEEIGNSIFNLVQNNTFDLKIPFDISIHHLFFD